MADPKFQKQTKQNPTPYTTKTQKKNRRLLFAREDVLSRKECVKEIKSIEKNRFNSTSRIPEKLRYSIT